MIFRQVNIRTKPYPSLSPSRSLERGTLPIRMSTVSCRGQRKRDYPTMRVAQLLITLSLSLFTGQPSLLGQDHSTELTPTPFINQRAKADTVAFQQDASRIVTSGGEGDATIKRSDQPDGISQTVSHPTLATAQQVPAIQHVKTRLIVLGVAEKEEQIQVGNIPSHETRTIELRLRNERNRTVTIHDIKTDCGCTKTEIIHGTALPNEHLTCRIKLASSNRLGPLVRYIVLQFEGNQNPDLKITLAANVQTPITLRQQRIEVSGEDNEFILAGLMDNQTSIVSCKAVRGSISVTDIQADQERFELKMKSFIRFGRSTDLLRFKIQRNQIPLTVDIPLEIISRKKAQFLPSTAVLRWNEGRAELQTRLVLFPKHQINTDRLDIKIDSPDPLQSSPTVHKVRWNQLSEVIVEMDVILIRPLSPEGQAEKENFHEQSNSQLIVFTSNEPRLATLSLIHDTTTLP